MNIVKQNDKPYTTGYAEIIMAAADAVEDLPLKDKVAVGSVAYKVTNDGLVVYMLTPENSWEVI